MIYEQNNKKCLFSVYFFTERYDYIQIGYNDKDFLKKFQRLNINAKDILSNDKILPPKSTASIGISCR